MRLTRGLLTCLVVVGWLSACSDDTQAPKDTGVDIKKVDSRVDLGTDATPPTPDGKVDAPVTPDQGADLPQTDGPSTDGPLADGPVPDTLAPDTLAPDTLAPDTLSPDTAPPVPTNGTCANAQTLTLVAGKAEANGDTSLFTDEHATLVCSGTTSALDGPQAYYKFAGTQDQWYKIAVAPEFGSAYPYVFTSAACTEAAIQTDCTSAGATGDASDFISSGDVRTIYFKAPATGDVYVAVDSTFTTTAGKFKLTVSEFTPPTNISCENAQALTFTGGKTSVMGDTSPRFSPNLFGIDVDCGSLDLDGPQVYYRFTAQANAVYRFDVTLTGSDSLRYYLFSAASCPATGGVAANIDTDCSTGGVGAAYNTTLDSFGVGTVAWTAPAAGGDFILAVDSTDDGNHGEFKLDVTENFTPATNGTCAAATPITLTNGKATINGDTTGTTDEYGIAIDCGGSDLDGPQVYYELTPAAGKMYKVTIKPTFSAYGFWFQKASCGTGTTIDGDCSSAGVTGNRSPFVSSGSTEVMYVGPSANPLIIGIDSTSPTNQGAFTLEVEEMNAPTNGTCATATPITLTAGKATVNGTTGGTADEFGTAVDCGTSDFDGPNAYYEFTPTAGKAYNITLKPNFSAYLYWFQKASCGTATTIDADCATSGTAGDYTGSISSGGSGNILVSGATAPIIIGIDSTAGYNSGDFVLEVAEVLPPSNDVCAGATPLTLVAGAATATGDTSLVGTTDSQNQSCASGTPGPDLFYALPVTAGGLYEITVTPATGFDPALYILDGCANATCLGGADVAFSGSAETVIYSAGATGTVIIGVDGWSATSTSGRGAFTLDVKTLTPAAGETCSTALPMTFTGTQATASGDNTTFLNISNMASSESCTSGSTVGKDVFYSVPVTAGTVYRATLTPGTGKDLSLYVLPDCVTPATTGCIAGSDINFTGTNNLEEVTFSAKTTGNVIIVVDGNGTATTDEGSFTLTVDQIAPAMPDFCSTATAITLTAGVATVNGDTSTATNTLQMANASCVGDATPGPDVFYSLSVTAGSSYLIEVEPGTGYNTTIYAFTDCATPIQSCLAGGDATTSTGAAGAESMLVTATATGSVLIGVDSDSTSSSSNNGSFVMKISEITSAPTGLVLQEVNVGSVDYAAIKNTGANPVNLAGVQIFMTDSTYTSPDVRFNLPSISLAAGATLYLPESGVQAGEYDIGSIPYTSTSSFVTVLCFGPCSETNAANVLDAALFGTTAQTLPTGVAFTGGPVGGITSTTEDTTSYVRATTAGVAPNFLASDWTTGPATR